MPDPAADVVLSRIGQNLASWRKLHRLTQQQVADRAGVSQPVIARLEHGEPGVGIGALVRVAAIVGISEELLAATDPYQTSFGRALSERTQVQRVRRKSPPTAPVVTK